jgi:nicotinamide-nucleotide adenylyltransferase
MGHVKVIEWILERFDEVIIVIGSAQDSFSPRNPFTASERAEMIRLTMEWLGIPPSRYSVIPAPDIEMNYVWVRYLEMMAPRFDVAVSRNPLVIELFRSYGVPVVEPPSFERDKYVATRIRELMIRGGRWEDYVPPPVVEYIKSIGGIERLRRVAESD